MEQVKIYYTNGKTETINCAVGTNGTTAGFEFMLHTGDTLFFPHQHYRKIKRKRLTDEEILSSNDKSLVEWYVGFKEKYEKDLEEKKAEEGKAELEPVPVEGQDVEE